MSVVAGRQQHNQALQHHRQGEADLTTKINRPSIAVLAVIDSGIAELVVEVFAVVFMENLEAVEDRLVHVEGLAVWVVEVSVGGDVLASCLVTTSSGEASEGDVEGGHAADSGGQDCEAEELHCCG